MTDPTIPQAIVLYNRYIELLRDSAHLSSIYLSNMRAGIQADKQALASQAGDALAALTGVAADRVAKAKTIENAAEKYAAAAATDTETFGEKFHAWKLKRDLKSLDENAASLESTATDALEDLAAALVDADNAIANALRGRFETAMMIDAAKTGADAGKVGAAVKATS